MQGGTGKDANFGIPEAGKTGTTTSNVDAWFVGYTPKLTAAVWMGYPDRNRSMDNVHGIQIQGGTLPAEMWRKFMQAVTANTDPGVFPDPGDISVGTRMNPGLSLVTTPPTTRPTPTTTPSKKPKPKNPKSTTTTAPKKPKPKPKKPTTTTTAPKKPKPKPPRGATTTTVPKPKG